MLGTFARHWFYLAEQEIDLTKLFGYYTLLISISTLARFLWLLQESQIG